MQSSRRGRHRHDADQTDMYTNTLTREHIRRDDVIRIVGGLGRGR